MVPFLWRVAIGMLTRTTVKRLSFNRWRPARKGERTEMRIATKLSAAVLAVAGLLAGSVSAAGAASAAAKPARLPVLYNYTSVSGGWTLPQVRPAAFLIFIDGSAFRSEEHTSELQSLRH